MKRSCILVIGGALALLVSTGDTHAAQRRMSVITRADYAGVAKVRYYRKRGPLEVNIYARRRRVGGYSYRTTDVGSRDTPQQLQRRGCPWRSAFSVFM
jgi:hypothetical protein